MKHFIMLAALLCWVAIPTARASVIDEISKATKAGNTVLLVVTEPGAPDESKALAIAKDAKELHQKTTIIKMNRADKDNATLVKKYQLAGVPLPAILVIAPNGVVAGGAIMQNATPEYIVSMIPTPRKAATIKAVQDGKSVFLVVSKKSHNTKDVLSKCRTACSDMSDKAVIINVDFDDTAEKRFLSELNISKIGTDAQTYVINSKGQLTGSFTGATDARTLVATASKAPASGCCPPGSGSSCGPTKK